MTLESLVIAWMQYGGGGGGRERRNLYAAIATAVTTRAITTRAMAHLCLELIGGPPYLVCLYLSNIIFFLAFVKVLNIF
jgi:hypothetical protein